MRGVVLRRDFFREHDLRVVVLSEEIGKIEVIARGAAKFESKMAAHLEPFNVVSFDVVRGRMLQYFRGVFCIECFCEIKEDLKLVDLASRAIFFTNHFVKEEQACSGVFDLLVEALFVLNNCGEVDVLFFIELYLVKLCEIESLLPDEGRLFEYCVYRRCWKGSRESFCVAYLRVIERCKGGRLIDVLRSEFGVDEVSVLRSVGLYFYMQCESKKHRITSMF